MKFNRFKCSRVFLNKNHLFHYIFIHFVDDKEKDLKVKVPPGCQNQNELKMFA